MAATTSHHRGAKKAIVVLVALAVLLGGAAVGATLYLQHRLDAGIDRFGDPFSSLTSRPAVQSTEATAPVNFLVLGSDSRVSAGDPADWQRGAQRTDAIMVAQLNGDRDKLVAMSLPRDAWVEVPGHGEHKLNAAFSLGGPSLTVSTVEQLTGILIDHVVIADFESFASVTDVVGGVSIELDRPLEVGDVLLPAGAHLLSGAEALAYVRQRDRLPGGDLARIERQQVWMRSVMQAVHREGVLVNPGKLATFLETVGETLAVDDDLTVHRMRNLAFSAVDLRARDLVFTTAPILGTGRSPDGTQSIVRLDEVAFAELCAAFASGTAAEHLSLTTR